MKEELKYTDIYDDGIHKLLKIFEDKRYFKPPKRMYTEGYNEPKIRILGFTLTDIVRLCLIIKFYNFKLFHEDQIFFDLVKDFFDSELNGSFKKKVIKTKQNLLYEHNNKEFTYTYKDFYIHESEKYPILKVKDFGRVICFNIDLYNSFEIDKNLNSKKLIFKEVYDFFEKRTNNISLFPFTKLDNTNPIIKFYNFLGSELFDVDTIKEKQSKNPNYLIYKDPAIPKNDRLYNFYFLQLNNLPKISNTTNFSK